MKQADVRRHFDRIANRYDSYKEKNPFYYSAIKSNLRRLVPPRRRILDFGCGTGEILAFLSPSRGVGYDISRNMVAIAARKFQHRKELHFGTSLPHVSGPFDFILLVDVMEHLAEPQKAFRALKSLSGRNTRVIVSFVDRPWEPVLLLLELARLKMPEGPHRRSTVGDLEPIASSAGFEIVERERARIVPSLPFRPLVFLTLQAT